MQGAAVVKGGATGRQRTRDRVRGIERRDALEGHDARVGIGRAMFEHRAAMRARQEMHAAIYHRRGLQRHPDADLLVVRAGIIAVRLVLMPRRRGAVARRLEDRVVKPGRRLGPEQLPGDGEGIGKVTGLAQFGRESRGLRNLRQRGRSALRVDADEIVLRAHFPTDALAEKALEGSPHRRDFIGRSDLRKDDETVGEERLDLLGC